MVTPDKQEQQPEPTASTFTQQIFKNENLLSSDNTILSNYCQRAKFAYCLGISTYIFCMISALGMIIIGIIMFFLNQPSFYQKAFSIGIFLVGSLLLLIVFLRNPITFFQRVQNQYIRSQVLLSTLQFEQDIYRREVEKLFNQTPPINKSQLDDYLNSLRESSERVLKNISPQDEWLNDYDGMATNR